MSAVEVTAWTYEQADRGEVRKVDADHVRRFLDAASFFDGLSGRPEVHEQDAHGTITVTRWDPSGNEHVTVFTPLD